MAEGPGPVIVPTRRQYKFDEIVDGKPQYCELKCVVGPQDNKDHIEHDLLYDRLRPEAAKVEELADPEKEVVLNMMADLANDTVVILGKSKIKLQLEDDMRAKNLEWECFKKKNEDWKELLALQKAAEKSQAETDEETVEEKPSKTHKRKSTVKTPGRTKKVKNATDDKSSTPRTSKKLKDVSGTPKSSKKIKETKTPRPTEPPKSPRKENSVLHPFFARKPIAK